MLRAEGVNVQKFSDAQYATYKAAEIMARAAYGLGVKATGDTNVDVQKENATAGAGAGVRYSIREEFEQEVTDWIKNTPKQKRQYDGGYFRVGKTSDVLKRIGVRDANIYWRKSKMQDIMDEHPKIDESIIKKVPYIVENPIIVMKSLTRSDSITMFGDLKVGDEYVMVAVSLTPIPAGGMEAKFNLITSAYNRSLNNAKTLLESSEVLYISKKHRADSLSKSLGVQFPSDQQAYDSTYGSITYFGEKVNITGKKLSEIIASSKAITDNGGNYANQGYRQNEEVVGVVSNRDNAQDADTVKSNAEPPPVVNKKNAEISRPSLRPGRVLRGEGVNVQKFSDAQYATYKAAEIMARALGTDIVIHESLGKTVDGKVINGYFDPKDGRIHVNINAMRDGSHIGLYVLSHEVTHAIKEWSPRKYAELETFVMEHLGADAEAKIQAKLKQMRDAGLISETATEAEAYALAKEEVVADGMEDVLSDGKVLEALAKQNRTLWQKIKDVVTAAIGKIKAAFGDLNKHSKTAQVLTDTVESLESLEQLFYEGVVDAGEARRSGTTGAVTRMNSGKMQVSGDPNADYADYDKPITFDDVKDVQEIAAEGDKNGKSINRFTSEEIKKTLKWAYKFYKELGVKSPFFRAWFGEWRAHDRSEIKITSVPTIDVSQVLLAKGNYQITDTGWTVYAGKVLNDDTRHHSGGNRINVKALSAIDTILGNAILLDTVVSKPDTNKKSENTAFLHKLYTLVEYDGRIYIAKTTVEEYYNETTSAVSRRAYNLKAIKIEPAGGQLGIESSSSRPSTGSIDTVNSAENTLPIISIADLYALVKQFDKEFSPAPEVSKHVLNEDGMPKVFYHGSTAVLRYST